MKNQNCKLLIFSYLKMSKLYLDISKLSRADRKNLLRIKAFVDTTRTHELELKMVVVPPMLSYVMKQQLNE